MIDFYEIVMRIVLSPEDRARIPKYDKTRPPEKMHKFDVLEPLSWTATQGVKIRGNSVRLKVCPQKVLGKWNAFGTNDFRQAVLNTAPAVLQQLGLAVTPAIMTALEAGDYAVKGVHITEHFYLKERSISEFIRQLFRRLGESEMPEMIRRGVGFHINPRSRYVSFIVYDKAHQFDSEIQKNRKQRRQDVYERRMADLPEQSLTSMFLGLDRAMQRMVAGSGPRLEIKFGDQYFAKSDLNKGSAWTTETATNLYRQQLKKLKLPVEVSATVARARAKQVLSSSVFPTFVLWALGDDVRDLKMSAKKLSSHRKLILEKMGYDILKAASATFSTEWKVNAAAVFNWENRIDVNAMNIDELWHLGAPATDNHRTVLQ